MSVVAQAEIEVDKPVSEVFERFRDFGRWAEWMPAAFTPVKGPEHPLRVGDQITVRLAGGIRSQLRVVRVRDDKEVCWRGGVPGLIVGEHSFFFDDLGDGRTRIRSSEPFTGLLLRLRPVAQRIERDAGQVGLSMLERFVAHVS